MGQSSSTPAASIRLTFGCQRVSRRFAHGRPSQVECPERGRRAESKGQHSHAITGRMPRARPKGRVEGPTLARHHRSNALSEARTAESKGLPCSLGADDGIVVLRTTSSTSFAAVTTPCMSGTPTMSRRDCLDTTMGRRQHSLQGDAQSGSFSPSASRRALRRFNANGKSSAGPEPRRKHS